MMAELGDEVSCAGVARRYAGVCDALVIDTTDAAEAPAIEALGMRALVTPTVMQTDDDKQALAREIVGFVAAWSPQPTRAGRRG